jgi:hypothetical protein
MKSHTTLKTLGLCALATLTLNAGLAQADGRSCLFDPPAMSSVPQAGVPTPGASQAFGYPQEVRQQMARIEAALRNGQITPYEAGQLMRQQWEIAQFQRGFLASSQPARAGGCGLINPDLAEKLAPLGDMAKSGMQTASTLMRALMRETERLLREPASTDVPSL